MNYPNQNDNPARQALTRAVDRAIVNGSPVVVNVAARKSAIVQATDTLASAIAYVSVSPMDCDAREDALHILNVAIETCFADGAPQVYKIHCNTRCGLWEVMLETLSTGEWTRVFSATNKDTCKSWVRDNPIR
jgi:hypothetical protein